MENNAVPEGNGALYVEEVSGIVREHAVVEVHVLALVNVNQLVLAVAEELAGLEENVL